MEPSLPHREVHVAAVVLAAGRSRRMGPGVQKLLLPFGGSTVIGHVVGQIAAAGVGTVIVVTGMDERVAAAARAGSVHPVTVVVNDEPESDMLESARRGMRALPARCDGVLLAVGDQPGVTSALVRRLVEAYTSSAKGIVVPVLGGRRGHPLLLGVRYVPKVLAGYDGVGVRGLLGAHPDEVLELPVDDPGAAADVDVPEDYWREVARAGE